MMTRIWKNHTKWHKACVKIAVIALTKKMTELELLCYSKEELQTYLLSYPGRIIRILEWNPLAFVLLTYKGIVCYDASYCLYIDFFLKTNVHKMTQIYSGHFNFVEFKWKTNQNFIHYFLTNSKVFQPVNKCWNKCWVGIGKSNERLCQHFGRCLEVGGKARCFRRVSLFSAVAMWGIPSDQQ